MEEELLGKFSKDTDSHGNFLVPKSDESKIDQSSHGIEEITTNEPPNVEPNHPVENLNISVDLSHKTAEELDLESLPCESIHELVGGGSEVNFIKKDSAAIFKPESSYKYKRERAAYLVDRSLGLGLVPTTVIRELGGRKGCSQLFITDAKTAKESTADELDACRKELMKLWLFDTAIANNDRHPGNYLLKEGKVYAIDHSNAFHHSYHPKVKFFDEPISSEVIQPFLDFKANPDRSVNLEKELSMLMDQKRAAKCVNRIKNIARILSQKDRLTSDECHSLFMGQPE